MKKVGGEGTHWERRRCFTFCRGRETATFSIGRSCHDVPDRAHHRQDPSHPTLICYTPTPQKKGRKTALGHQPTMVILRSNRKNKGLISTDRNNKVTLQRTIPRSKSQVVCKGFGSFVEHREIAMRGRDRDAAVDARPGGRRLWLSARAARTPASWYASR